MVLFASSSWDLTAGSVTVSNATGVTLPWPTAVFSLLMTYGNFPGTSANWQAITPFDTSQNIPNGATLTMPPSLSYAIGPAAYAVPSVGHAAFTGLGTVTIPLAITTGPNSLPAGVQLVNYSGTIAPTYISFNYLYYDAVPEPATAALAALGLAAVARRRISPRPSATRSSR